MTLYELIQLNILEGETIILLKSEKELEYSFAKLLRELTDDDKWLYARTIESIHLYDGIIGITLK